MIDLDEFNHHLEVQTNILNEKRKAKEIREQGIRAIEAAKER